MIKKGIVSLAVCLALQSNFALAYTLTGQEEMAFGNKIGDYYNQTTDLIQNINIIDWQKKLVQANPDVLNFKDDIHDRYLHEVLVLKGTGNLIETFALPAGHIYLSEGTLKLITAKKVNGTFCDCNNNNGFLPSNIYSVSSLLFLLGHESGHWANNDFRRGIEKSKCEDNVKYLSGLNFADWSLPENYSKAQAVFGFNKDSQWGAITEREADITSIKLNENYTDLNGIAGGLIYFSRMKDIEKNPRNQRIDTSQMLFHDSTEVRFNKLLDYVMDSSGKELYFNNLDSFNFDGMTFTPPSNTEVTSLDRAYYVGAQLGRISKFDSRMSLYNLKIRPLNKTSSISALVYSKDGTDFIIDRFELSVDEVQELLNEQKEASTAEEEWLVKIANVFS